MISQPPICLHSRHQAVSLQLRGGFRERIKHIGHKLSMNGLAILKHSELKEIDAIVRAKHASCPVVPRPYHSDFTAIGHVGDYGVPAASVSL